MEKPDLENCRDKQFEKWWWYDYNKSCLDCINSCKQSHIVKVICNNYKKKEII